ncbi:MAG: hypothetical protein RL101_979, partial [Actinomycetota bacterium]
MAEIETTKRRTLRAKPFSRADRAFYGISTLAANSSIVLVALI